MNDASRVSVIIPALNEAALLPRLLAQISDADIVGQVIVSDGGSTDGTSEIATQCGATIVRGPAGRGGQFSRGIETAPRGWLLLLHADSTLPEEWSSDMRKMLNEADPSRAYYGRLRFTTRDPRARVLEGLVALRCALFHLPYGDQGLLIHRDLIEEIGGMPELALMEDVALARRLGRRMRPMRLVIETDASAYERDGWLRRSLRNLVRLTRFLAGTSSAHLTPHYRR